MHHRRAAGRGPSPTAHFGELLTGRLHMVDGIVSAESFFVLKIHEMAYGWGVGEVAVAGEPYAEEAGR